MDDCLNVKNIKLKIILSSILFNGANILFQQGCANNIGKYKIDDNNHSDPNHTHPQATTISNKISNQLKSFPDQGSQHRSENIDITFCSNNATKGQINGGRYTLLSKY
jgi:hypothetical protein